MKNLFKTGSALLILFITTMYMGNAIAMAIQAPEAMPFISLTIGVLGLIPLEQSGILSTTINAASVLFAQGTTNPGGIEGKVYYAFEEDISQWPAKLVNIDTSNVASFAELVTVPLADKFVFKAGKCFHELYCTLETGEIKYSLIGTRDSRSFSNAIEISFPGNSEDFLGFIASAANRRMVFLVPEQNGKVRVLGTPKFPAQLETVEGSGGKLMEDPNAAVQTYLSKSPIPAAVYKPAVELEPAS